MRGDCIYPKVVYRMYLKGWDFKALSDVTDITYTTLRRKLRGVNDLTLKEAIAIRNALNSKLTLDDLFDQRDYINEDAAC